jgi:hypothetical protein
MKVIAEKSTGKIIDWIDGSVKGLNPLYVLIDVGDIKKLEIENISEIPGIDTILKAKLKQEKIDAKIFSELNKYDTVDLEDSIKIKTNSEVLKELK